MNTPSTDLNPLHDKVGLLNQNLRQVILGKDEVINLILSAFFAEGHVLIYDVPGVGKTTLAKSLARSIDANFHRIQFTPDLLPTDILGGSIYNPKTGEFSLRHGPIFTNILLADEINRASPRTQSAMLEAMTENQVTIEGVGYPLTPPFVVLATQNPIEFHGTYPLPESQLDRFMIRTELGYPSGEMEYEVLGFQRQDHPLETIKPVMDFETVIMIQKAVKGIHVDKEVGLYILEIVRQTRADTRLRLGASPRAAIMLYRMAQSYAFLNHRDYVLPDDVKALSTAVLAHRLVLDSQAKFSGNKATDIIIDIISQIPVPV
jgi:MoxR-like ATPase